MKDYFYRKLSVCLLVMFLVITGSFILKEDVFAETGGKVYVTVEKFTIGQGYLIEPCVVTLQEGDNAAIILDRVLKNNGFSYKYTGKLENTYFGYYLRGIDNADNGILNIPECIKNMPAIAKPGQTEPDQPPDGTETNKEGSGLYEFSYTSQSGWMYSVKGIFPGVGMSAYELQDGDVLRVQFTIHGIGADLGGKYDSNSYSLKLPDREDITKRLALINQNKEACFELGGCADAYQKACNAVVDLDTSEEKMIEVYQALPSENSIAIYIEKYNSNKASLVVSQINALGSVSLSNESQIVAARKAYNALTTEQKALVSADILSKLTQAEQNLSQLKAQTAAEQAAAEQKAQQKALQQALIKQNTPANTTLKSVKKTGTKKAKLTWKKVKDASGYEIYMSTKKSSGYKKIKTIKKAKTVTFTKSGLKKKKTYYFKVRTYRTVNGVTYYGSYSNVKQVKIK